MSKYGIAKSADCPQSTTPEWEPDSSMEQISTVLMHTNHQGMKTGKTRQTRNSPNGGIHTKTNQAKPQPSNHNSNKSHGVYDATGGDEIPQLGIITGTSPFLQLPPSGGKAMGVVEVGV